MTELSGHIRFTGEQQAVSTMGRVNVAVKETAASLGKLLTRAELSEVELGRLKAGLVTVNWAAQNLKGGFETGISLMGRWMAGATALTGVMGAAANSFGNYSMKLAEVSTLLPPGVSGFERYDDSVKALAVSAGQATDVVAQGLYQALSSSVPEDNVLSFMKKAADLSVGGVTDLKTSVDGLTNVMNAYGLGVDQVDQLSAVFFNTMRQGKTTVGELASNVGQLAPLAAQLGVPFEELGSAWVSLTKVGLKTSEAGTQLKAILQGMLKPTSEATKAAAEWGYTFDASSNIALLRARGLTGALEEVNRITGGSAERLGLLLPSVEALGGGMRLVSEEGKHAFLDAMDSMPKSAEEAAAMVSDAVGKMRDDVGFKTNQLKVALGNSWLEIGEGIITGLSPNLDAAVDMVAGAGDRIREGATAFASGIRAGLMASGIGDTIKGLFETADQQQKWKELGEVIGRVTGEILSVLEKLVHLIDTVSTAFGGLDNAAAVLFGGWLGSKALVALATLRAELALTAGASAATAKSMGWAFAGKAGLWGAAAFAGYAAGQWAGDKLSYLTSGKTEDSSWYAPEFENEFRGRAVMADRGPTGDGTPINRLVGGSSGKILAEAAAGNQDAVLNGIRGGLLTSALGDDPFGITRARLEGARLGAERKQAIIGQYQGVQDDVASYFDMLHRRGEMEKGIDELLDLGGQFEALGDKIGAAVANSMSRAKSTVEVISQIEVKDGKGRTGSARRKERGVGAAMNPKVALNNYFILTDDEDVLAIPDEFIYDMPRIRDTLD